MHTIVSRLKDKVIELKTKNISDEVIRVMLKEMLQDYILVSIYSNKKFKDIVFIGGTALRKLYNLNRFSEDLDFISETNVNFEDLGDYVIDYFKNIAFKEVNYSIQQSENVNRLTFKFKIISSIGLSNNENDKLHVKIEITKGKVYQTELFTKNLSNNPLVLKSYSLPILMSGKISACLNRVFLKGNSGVIIKGRDYYDLIWYMEQRVIPSLPALLNTNSQYTISHVFKLLDDKVKAIKNTDLLLDLKNFFEDTNYIEIWCNSFQELYSKYRKFYS